MRCNYKTFTKIKLCPTDLDHLLSIGQRTINGDHPDDTAQDITSVTTLAQIYAACETVKPTRPVQLLNTNTDISHMFYVRFADLFIEIDVTQHLITDEAGILYRIEAVEDLGEYHETIALYCKKGGDIPESRS
ncbi:phage head completion protein [Neisseria sp. Ec49-e6-T10]|uniref:phage head completion protein n=1 Tax=Neisseria sp. Ec49-e6-T10 TaxID=3140744 RepID=UPI003EB8AAA4